MKKILIKKKQLLMKNFKIMKKTLFFAFSLVSVVCFSQQHTLTIEVDGFDNDKGQLVLGLCNKKEKFLKEFAYGDVVMIKNKKATVVFKNLPSGEYAISLFHDVNSNNTLDKNMFGIPSEDYGFSNNAKGAFGPPKYEDAKFNLYESKLIAINL
jgi:uncharacterized protein (DUF2141 family)